jgi:hypothetical protein
MMVIMEQLVQYRLGGETEVIEKKTCPSATLFTTNPTRPGNKPGSPRCEAGDYPPELWHSLSHVPLLPYAITLAAEQLYLVGLYKLEAVCFL